MSLLWTASLNEAKRVLADPLSRARYIATGKGEVDESKRITLSPDFLEKVFELQMEAMENPQATGEKARHEHDALYQRLENIFKGWEQDRNDNSLREVEILLAQLKYFKNLLPKNR